MTSLKLLPTRNDMPLWRIICCTFAMCGIQVCYAAQINMGTSELLALGLSERSVSIAWLAGPLSGLIVQPIIGIISDSCVSRLGRRRPFLIIGTLLTTAALLMFSNAEYISEKIFRNDQKYALLIALFSFFLLDFSIQAIQAPLRALVTDIVPVHQRTMANSYIGVFTGFGNLIGGILTSMNLKLAFRQFSTNTQALFFFSALVLTFSVTVCCMFSAEEPKTVSPEENSENRDQEIEFMDEHSEITSAKEDTELLSRPNAKRKDSNPASFLKILREIPSPFWYVFAIQMCTWCGFFSLFVYLNAWVGTNIFLGDGTAERNSLPRNRFERGVQLGGKGNAFMAFLTLVYAVYVPGLVSTYGIRKIYFFSQLIEALCLLSAPYLRGDPALKEPSPLLRFLTMTNITLFGIVWATTMAIPWTLIGNALDSHDWYSKRIGIFTTVFNASQSFPQLVVAFLSPFILSLSHDDVSYVMFSGGILALIGAFLVPGLQVQSQQHNFTQKRNMSSLLVTEKLFQIRQRKSKNGDTITHADYSKIFEKSFDDESALLGHFNNNMAWIR